MNFSKSRELQKRSHTVIPGGAHTYAKGDDQYPLSAPAFIVRGKGCHVWDVDGNEFIEYGMGLRSVSLGHAYEPVLEAVSQELLAGNNFTRPAPIEIECAERLLDLIHGAEMVKFAKNGSDATTAAVKLARAYTGRELVAICAEHPFFSVDDWFIGTTDMASGIPKPIRDQTIKFHYNDLESIRRIFDQYPNQVACIVMELETITPPEQNFLNEAYDLSHKHGALFIADEIITGFRWHLGGAQRCYGVLPDLCTFGKAMSNGFSLAALLGRRDIMELGGLFHSRERVFLLSTTFGAETHCLRAALATMQIFEDEHVIEHLYQQGSRLRKGINEAIEECGLQDYFQVAGKPPNLIYITRNQDKERSQAFRTLFLQETIKRGLLMPSLVVSFSHLDRDIDQTVEGIAEALQVYRKALDEGVEKYLVGRPVAPVFRKFN